MFKTLWFLFIACLLTLFLVWLLDHNGSVTILWLGFEAKTDIITAILLTLLFTFLISVIAYTLAKILSIKFPSLSKLFHRTPHNPLIGGEDKHAKIFTLKTKLKAALDKKNDKAAIAYAKEILAIKIENDDVLQLLDSLYSKGAKQQEAQESNPQI